MISKDSWDKCGYKGEQVNPKIQEIIDQMEELEEKLKSEIEKEPDEIW